MMTTEDLLKTSLACAVPLRILELQTQHRLHTHRNVQESMRADIICLECEGTHKSKLHPRQQGEGGHCSVCGGKHYLPRNIAYSYYIGSHGDDLLFKSKQKGKTAKVFNVLADSLARMAFFPAGVKIFGMCFEVPEPFAKKIRKVVLEVNSIDEYVKLIRKPI